MAKVSRGKRRRENVARELDRCARMQKPTIRGEKKTFSVCLPSSIARPTRFRASISFARVLVPFKRLLRRPKFSFFRVTYLFFQMIIVCLNGVKLVAHLSSCLLKVVYLKKNALITFYGIISHVIFTCEDIMFSRKSSRYCIGGHIMKSALSFWTPGYLKPTTNGKQTNFQQTL